MAASDHFNPLVRAPVSQHDAYARGLPHSSLDIATLPPLVGDFSVSFVA